MTTATVNISNSGTGNGSNKVFTFTFRVLDDADIVVTVAGVTKALNTDYTVQRDFDGEGGTVTFVTAPVNTAAVVMTRTMALTQPLGLTRQGTVPKPDFENALDRLTMLIQQVQASISAAGVSGPGTSGDNSIALWSGTSGAALKDGVALGSNGQVLTSNGPGLAPSFQNVSGTGTVTSFSAGDLSPLFTTTEATITTTPALAFVLSNAAANTVFGNNLGSLSAPAYGNIVSAQFGSNILDVNHGGTGNDWSAQTAGKLPVFTGTGALGTLAIGSNGQVLTLVSGVPAWAAAGAGTVTTFSAGDLSPLFTTSEANPTTTPALTFALSTAAAYTVFGNNTGAITTPAFGGVVNNQLPVVDQSHGGTTFSAYSDGDIIVVNAAGNLAKLPLGSNGQVLSINTANNPKFAWSSVGSGSVTNFSAGDLSPLFTTSEATTTTTPALTFTLSNAAANTVFGNNTGSTAAPAFQTLAAGQLGLTTAGDILVTNNTPALTRLALGTNGQVLTIDTSLNPKFKWATPGGGGGSGTVTDFSAGDLSPIFTTTEATTTTTPALSFVLTNAAANTVFGNNTGSSAAPAYQTLSAGQVGMTTAGDILVANNTPALTRFALGANTQVLSVATASNPKLAWIDTVSNFSAGDLSPLFTTSEATTTTTPALTFSLSTATAYTVFGRDSSSTGAPAYTESGQLTRLKPVAKSANFTAAWGESYPVSTAGGSVTCTIPAATGSGKFIYVSHETSGNTMTIQRTGTDTLSGLTSFSTTARYDGYLIHDIASGTSAVM